MDTAILYKVAKVIFDNSVLSQESCFKLAQLVMKEALEPVSKTFLDTASKEWTNIEVSDFIDSLINP
jgi:hypothetical protein